MSNDDIIRSWKESQPEPKPETPADTPPNPAGDGELPTEELENVAGGAGGTYEVWTFGCCPPTTESGCGGGGAGTID